MTITDVTIKTAEHPNETIFELTNGVLIGTPAAALNAAIINAGVSPLWVRALVASPSYVGEFVFASSLQNGQYQVSLDGTAQFVVEASIQLALSKALQVAAITAATAAGVTLSAVPLAIVIGITTTVVMVVGDDQVDLAVAYSQDAVKAAINGVISTAGHINSGAFTDSLGRKLIQFDQSILTEMKSAWKDLEQASDPYTTQVADAVLGFLDGLFGTPDDTAPLSDHIVDFKQWFASLFNSPICVDLQLNGLSLTSRANADVFFDVTGNGFAKDVGWIQNTEAFLVRDSNGNGLIDSVAEMFGDNNGTSAFAKLKALDTNNSNTLTGSELSTLKLWVDQNGDGVTQAGELKSLATYNIAQIDVTKQAYTATLSGNKVDGFVNLKNAAGAVVSKGYDVFFETDSVNSWFVGSSLTTPPAVSATALLSPLSRGFGEVKALHYALTESPALQTKLNSIAALSIATQMTAVDKQITELLTLWAGKTAISATSANVGGINGINGQTFEVVQAFAGQDYVRNGTGSLIPNLDGSVYLHRAYAALAEHVKEVVLVQSVLKDVFSTSYYDFSKGDVVMNDTLANILIRAENLEPTNAAQNKAYWGHIAGIVATHAAEFSMTESAVLSAVNTKAGFVAEAYTTYLLGTSSVDKFTGTSDADVMDMLAGNDSVFAGLGNDTVLGGAGNDSLEGHIGNDRLDGGANNDLLQGGNDTDIIIGGAGKDTMTGGSGMDMFVFAATAESSSAAATVDSITDFSVVDDTIDINVMTYAALDTDGGLTETNDLRTYHVAASNTTFIRSDQTNFEIALTGGNFTLTNADFMW